ncbi:MAG: VWA domain-containing protein [Planctomycetia bacterium]|nr:VWA domain-containing protein [Planctomycetia bacterium]
MSWNNPGYLLGLWTVPLILWIYYRSIRRRRILSDLLARKGMSELLLPHRSRFRMILKGIFLVIALSLFWFSLSGPEFGVKLEKVNRKGTDLIVLLDTSRSMLAEDLAPNRLEAARLDIEDLLKVVHGDRIGLVAFAGKPVVQVPLTSDFGFFRERLKNIDTNVAPMGGTAIGDAIRFAARLLPRDKDRDKALILITDGEDLESMPQEAAKNAASLGIRIYTIALGNFKEGARIPIFDQNGKRTGYEKYNGQEVWSKADTQLLKQIAEISGGVYIPAGTASFDLGQIYSDHLDQLKRGNYQGEEKQVLQEQFQTFLFPGIIAFMIFFLISPYKEPADFISNQKSDRMIASGNSLALLLAGFLCLSSSGIAEEKAPLPAQETVSSANQNSAALSSQEPAKEPERKEKSAEQPSSEKKETSFEKYNRASQLLQEGKAEEAMKIFEEIVLDKNGKIAARTHYNLGLLYTEKLKSESEKPIEPEKTSPNIPATQDPSQPVQQAPQDPLKKYGEELLKRQEKLKTLFEIASLAEEHFRESAKNQETKIKSEENLDLLKSWKYQQIEKARKEERDRRANELPFPAHLQWLENEQRAIDDGFSPKSDSDKSPSDYQNLYESGTDLADLNKDLASLTEKYRSLKEQQNQGKNPEKSIDFFESLLKRAEEKTAKSSDHLLSYKDKEGKEILRNSIEDLNSIRTLLLSWPDLVNSSVAFQEKVSKESKDLFQNGKGSGSDYQKKSWESQFIDRWTSLMQRLAQQELARKKAAEKKENPDLPKKEKTPQMKKEENNPADPRKQMEEKIEKSMEIAVQIVPRIKEELASLQKGLKEKRNQSIPVSEDKLLEYLKEIAKPLQDPNQQNKDQQKKDQKQDSSQDQKKQEKEPSQDPKKDSSGEKKKPQESKEKKDREKEIDALMRKVRQRQQDAHDAREAFKRYFLSTEKPEKDW